MLHGVSGFHGFSERLHQAERILKTPFSFSLFDLRFQIALDFAVAFPFPGRNAG